MNTFKKKSLYAALAGVSALGVTGAAQAVNVNPEGLGQVLIYPYFTTRADNLGNAYGTLLSVVNTTASAKAVKVRFLEGKNSREVLDFNLFLSAKDVWTAAILDDAATGGARVLTADRSCTLPAKDIWTHLGGDVYAQSFVNYAYVGDADDKGGASLDRTKEGYVEIIEMGTYSSSDDTWDAVTHVNGVPKCEDLDEAVAEDEIDGVRGGLFGGETLISVDSGTDFTADAVALDNFLDPEFSNYHEAGSTLPDLTQADPVSVVIGPDGAAYISDWSATDASGNPVYNNADPVSAVLIRQNVMNEYVLDAGTASGTDWVVTMPTKRFYVRTGSGLAPKLFQRNFNRTEGACDDVSLSIYDREERTTTTPLSFSPRPPTQTNALCWEANVLTFTKANGARSNVLGSLNVTNLPYRFENGWLDLGFFPSSVTGSVHKLINKDTDITRFGFGTSFGQTVTYVGLPVVGFMVQTFMNGTVQVGNPPVSVLSNYGGSFVHKYRTQIDRGWTMSAQ